MNNSIKKPEWIPSAYKDGGEKEQEVKTNFVRSKVRLLKEKPRNYPTGKLKNRPFCVML